MHTACVLHACISISSCIRALSLLSPLRPTIGQLIITHRSQLSRVPVMTLKRDVGKTSVMLGFQIPEQEQEPSSGDDTARAWTRARTREGAWTRTGSRAIITEIALRGAQGKTTETRAFEKFSQLWQRRFGFGWGSTIADNTIAKRLSRSEVRSWLGIGAESKYTRSQVPWAKSRSRSWGNGTRRRCAELLGTIS